MDFILEMDSRARCVEVYFPEITEAWHLEHSLESNGFQVIGPKPVQSFASIEELRAADLPEEIKYAARGLIGIPLNGKGR